MRKIGKTRLSMIVVLGTLNINLDSLLNIREKNLFKYLA